MTVGGGRGITADINVTPLVDVCLVLLIIFMVVTPLLQQGYGVALPETDIPEKMPEGAKQLTITIQLDGTMRVDRDLIAIHELPAKLLEIHQLSPDKDIVIKGDRNLKYRRVRKIMQLVNEAGFAGVGLVTEKRKA